ncbi:Cell division cycle protein 16-like protein [Dirofilaria immitis]|nr:Cell division cycle protein 16-like protein [Dirofilaria immitis]
MQQNQIAVKFPTTFYALFFIISAAVTDASIFGNRNHIRFRRPDDIWEPPFRTVLCENYPIRIQINADPDKHILITEIFPVTGQCALLIQLAFLEMFGKSPFGSSNTSAFGAGSSLFGSSANRPATAFGTQVTTQSTGLFGQKSIFGSPGQSTSLFGSTQPASSTSTSIFGQSKPLLEHHRRRSQQVLAAPHHYLVQLSQHNKLVVFSDQILEHHLYRVQLLNSEPPTSTDTMLRNGTNQTISTKHMCITAMKQYENKSLEELRCDDYLANRKGPQNGGLTFGQTSQPSSSLFGSNTNTTQSSIFSQNKPLFGSTSTGFGATTTTSSLLFGTPTTTTSIFGNKPVSGGLFGSSATTSPFGQTQTSTGLFSAKPSTGFGTQSSSLLVDQLSTPPRLRQAHLHLQSATSTASTSLFGAKPSTSGFGAFGASTSTASPFGSQSTGGIFGSKPVTGGLFGSNTGSLFGQAAPSSTSSLFGSSATKPTNSLFSSTATQPVFGSTQQVAGGNISPAAPIVLGADFNQWQIEKAVIEAQLAASPYGDNPLLKLLTTESQEKSNIPNPVSVERQIRFLASKKDGGAVTTTTPSGPLALGSIPAAASRIGSSSSKSRNSIGDFTYHSMFLPPGLRSNNKKNTSLNLDSATNRFCGTNGLHSSVDPSTFLGINSSQSSKSKCNSNVKKLDLSVLHKYMQENRRNSTDPVAILPSSAIQIDGDNETIGDTRIEIVSKTDTQSVIAGLTTTEQRTGVSFILPPLGSLSTDKTRAEEGRSPASSHSHSALRHPIEVSSSSYPCHPLVLMPHVDWKYFVIVAKIHSEQDNINSTLNINENSIASVSSENNAVRSVHPAGIILTRRDYECEPSLEELAQMALKNNAVCHIESGFTIRRLAFGSVFGLVVHFRQHEVIVYPDDNSKPPIGQELNRFAEDPLRLEEMGYRAKLERASLKMGAKFKDYRPETGTWVFTVPHFTKYGLMDDDDDDILDEVQLQTAFKASRIQNAVQRAKLPKLKVVHEDGTINPAASSGCINDNFQEYQQELKQFDLLSDSVFLHVDWVESMNTSFDTLALDYSLRSKIMSETEHKMDFYDNKIVLDLKNHDFVNNLLGDSMKIDAEAQEKSTDQSKMHLIDPVNEIKCYLKEGKQTVMKLAERSSTFIDGSLMNGRCGREKIVASVVELISLKAPAYYIFAFNLFQFDNASVGRVLWMSDIPNSLSVRCLMLQSVNQVSAEYVIDLFRKIDFMSKVVSNEDTGNLIFHNVPQRKPEGKFSDLISYSLATSRFNNMIHDSNVLELCNALLVLKSQKYLATFKRHEKPPPSGLAKVLHLMLIGDLEAAAEEAIESSYPHLACGLSIFKHTDRVAYRNQIEHWKRTKEYKFIDQNLLKIYLLMAGEMQAEIDNEIIFVNDGLDGLQTLCTFVWYFDPFDASLKYVLQAFENDLKARKAEHTLKCNIFMNLFNCWHLWFILRILRFKHPSESVEHTLHIRYAEQLCQMELYHLAAIVLMHISDSQSRNNALIELGDRIADKAGDETYIKLSTIARLPDYIIARSKYMRAKLEDDGAKMCLYALQDDYESLGQLADLFEEVSDRIPAWGPGGQIFTDFYRIKKNWRKSEMMKRYVSTWIKEIIEWAHSLELRLIAMPVNSPMQRLAATVMSKYVFKLIYGCEGTETENLPLSYEDKLKLPVIWKFFREGRLELTLLNYIFWDEEEVFQRKRLFLIILLIFPVKPPRISRTAKESINAEMQDPLMCESKIRLMAIWIDKATAFQHCSSHLNEMVGRGAIKQRPIPTGELSIKDLVQTSSSLPTSSTSVVSTPLNTSARIALTNCEFSEIDGLIQKYLTSAQYKTALFWADKRLALCRRNGSQPSFVDMARFIKVLAAAGEWTRLMAYCDRHELIMKHKFFAYFYVNALYKKDRSHDPMFSIMSHMVQLSKPKSFVPNSEEIAALDKMSEDLQIEAGLLLLLGKAYLMTQNRRAAFSCLQGAVYKDDSCIEAFELIQKYRLYSKQRFEELIERSGDKSSMIIALRNHYFSQGNKNLNADASINEALITDLSILTARAAYLYQTGDLISAYNITNEILSEAGIFQDCLLIHIATLVQLRKFESLFILAHQLVDSQPDNEVSWYTVDKCTSMNCAFGEGWLAFGHALTAESEHEQAMNCYLRASRVLEGSFEPLLYIGLEYAYANNTKLAQDFLKDAAEIAGDNALVLHEQGCICYMKKSGKNIRPLALPFFQAIHLLYSLLPLALLLAYNETDEYTRTYDLLNRPLSEFWEPLVNNLGHVKCKLGSYDEAIKFHQKALLMCPRKLGPNAGLAIAAGRAGDIERSVHYFHKSLNVDPHNKCSQIFGTRSDAKLDMVLEQGLHQLMHFLGTHANFLASHVRIPTLMTGSFEKFLVTKADLEGDSFEKQAQQKAFEILRKKRTKYSSKEECERKMLDQRLKAFPTHDISPEDVEMT